MSTFKTFVLKQMKRAGIGSIMGEKIFSSHQNLFIQAFTHESYSLEDNYQMLEAFGDVVLNSAIFKILFSRYPSLNQKSITFAFQKAKSEEILYLEAEKEGFFEHIRMSEEMKRDAINWRDRPDNFVPLIEETNTYIKRLEDTVESFCGALCIAVNEYSECKMGPGAEVVYNWAVPMIDNLPFDPTDISQTQNIKQKLKEFWDGVYAVEIIETGIKVSNNNMFHIDEKKPGRVVMTACDPDPREKYHAPIIQAVGYNQENARYKAACLAYPIVKERYLKKYAESHTRVAEYKRLKSQVQERYLDQFE